MMKLAAFCLFLTLFLYFDVINSQTSVGSASINKYFENLKKSKYNSEIRPEIREGDPVNVTCSMTILEFKIDEQNRELQSTFILRHSWTDPRLAYRNLDIPNITLDDPSLIWTPHLRIYWERDSSLNNAFKPNVLVRIDKDGAVLFSIRLTMTFLHVMDFRQFPYDTQTFSFYIASSYYFREAVDVSWIQEKPVDIKKSGEIPYKVEISNVTENINDYTYGKTQDMVAEFTFQRKTGYFVTKLYLPYIFLSALSWFTFWIPTKMAPHRLCLLFLIIYFMVIIGKEINAVAPKTPYMKGSDVWIAVCKTLVFATLLEFIAVNMMEVNKTRHQKCKNDDIAEINNPSAQEVATERSTGILARFRLYLTVIKPDSDCIESKSRIVFPVLFIIFNIIYWIIY